MKHKGKVFFISLIFLTTIFTATYSYANKSILDYYNSIPVNLLNGERYSLQLKNNKWITRSDAGYDFEATVDIKNGYLNIADSGTGGGTGTQELALYRTNTGSDIIGVNLTGFDGVGSACSLKFYKPADDQWVEVTGDLLPKIDLFLFMDGGYKVNERKMSWFTEFTKGITLMYQLPRIGTTMNVKIDLDRFIIENRRDEEGYNLKSAAYEIIRSVKYHDIKLIWDKKNNKFNPGEKTLFAPSNDLEKHYIHIPYR